MARRRALVERFLSRPVVEAYTPEQVFQTGKLLEFKRAKVGEVRRMNRNRHLYPEGVYVREVERLNASLQSAPKSGMDGHPGMFDTIKFADQAIGWTRVYMDGREAFGDGFVIDTARGRDVAACMRAGIVVGLSTRGTGTVTECTMNEDDPDWELNQDRGGVRFERINDDFSLQIIDAVVDAGVEDARVRAYEALLGQEDDDMAAEDKVTLTVLRDENAKLKAELDKLKADSTAAVEARAAELTKAFAEERARLEAAVPPKEKLALLDRLAKIDAAKLEAALLVAEGKAGPEATALEIKVAALEQRNIELAARLEAVQKEGADREAARAASAQAEALAAHISKVAGKNEELRSLLEGKCKTLAEVDDLAERVRKAAGAAGLAPGSGPVGQATVSPGSYSPSGPPVSGLTDQIRERALRLAGGPRVAAAAK